MVQGTRVDGTSLSSIFNGILTTGFLVSQGPSQAEQLLRVTSGIAAELIKAHDANQSVSLNEIRAKISKKFAFGGVPRLVDIISAIPDEYKKALLPKLRARPIRTASGVSTVHPVSAIADGRYQIAVVAVMCKPHRCPHIAMTGNICV
jgi:elongator complex protein 3